MSCSFAILLFSSPELRWYVTKTWSGERGNEKGEQRRELGMNLLIGLGFQLGFVPIFHFPVLVPPRCPLSNFQWHPMSQPYEWTKMQKMPILAEPGRPGTANLRSKPLRAKVYCKNRVISARKSHCPFRLKERKRNFDLGGAPSKGFATLHEEWRESCFFRHKILDTQSVTFRLVWAISRRNYFEMRSGKCGSWKRTGLWNGVKH